jgi:hypothetical protein
MRLFAFERRWLLAIFDTILPSGADERLPSGARDAPLERFVDDLFRCGPRRFLLGIRASLWIVVLAPIFLFMHARTIAHLSPAERLRVLERLHHHPRYLVREAATVVKWTACFGWAGLPEVQRRIGIFPVDAEPPAWARDPAAALATPRPARGAEVK